MSFGDQLLNGWHYFLIPSLLLLMICVLQVLDMRHISSPVVGPLLFGLHYGLRWLFSFAMLLLNSYFLVEIFPFNPTVSWIGVAFFFIWALGNFAYAVYLLQACSGPNLVGNFLIFVSSLVDLSIFSLIDPHQRLEKEISSLRNSNAFYQAIPLLLLQGYSLTMVVPVKTLVAIVFNLDALILLVFSEWVLSWSGVKRPGRLSAKSPNVDFMKVPLMETDTTQLPVRDSHLIRVFMKIIFPLVVVSFLPQALTILGIPHAVGCVKRYLSTKGGPPSWLEGRGYFLLSVNLLSLFFVLFVLLPFLSLGGLVLGLCNRIRHLWTPTRFPLFTTFRETIQALLSVLAFAYFPFLESLPVIRLERANSRDNPTGWKMAVAIGWFVGVEILLTLVDIVTDFYYSSQLLALNSDTLLTDLESLVTWTRISFFASCAGFVFGFARLGFVLFPFFQSPTPGRFTEVAISYSWFSKPTASSRFVSVLLLLHVLCDGVLQIFVVISTVKFVGLYNPLTIFNLALAVLTTSVHLSKVLQEFVFGKKISKAAKFGIQAAYFASLLILISVAIGAVLDGDEFCSLNRTITHPLIVSQIATCPSLGNKVQFNLTDGVDITFDDLGSLNSSLSFAGNSNRQLWLTFPELESVTGTLIMEDNANLVVNFTTLFVLKSGASLIFRNNPTLDLEFPDLTQIDGSITFEGNFCDDLDFSLVQTVKGTVVIDSNSLNNLNLSSLHEVPGILMLRNISDLAAINFVTLLSATNLTIIENPDLVNISFPLIEDSVFGASISSNPSLVSVDLGLLTFLHGEVRLSYNTNLTNLNVAALEQMDTTSGLFITDNPVLHTLDISELTCDNLFTVILRRNPSLSWVILNECRCRKFVKTDKYRQFWSNGTSCAF